MKKVVYLKHFKCKETIAVLQYVLDLAIAGHIDGMMLCFIQDGNPHYSFTGKFKADDEATFMTASKIARRISTVIDAKG